MARRGVRFAALLSSAAVISAFATTPVMGERQLALICEAQEIEIGRGRRGAFQHRPND
jgi:hypothetical protein